jgi:two-component system chemotaxis response regulator CheB
VVIGTSAGGIRAIEELVEQFTPEMDAAFFVVFHLARKGVGEFLFHRVEKQTSLPCKVATDGEKIERGTIYLAPPDYHMLLANDHIIIGKGAPENGWRPSINNLFRSAAANYGSRVIGIILTGLLDDGTAGMSNIKRSGGICIVQNPNEADYPDMPLSVLQTLEVDHCESLAKMGDILTEIFANKSIEETKIPEDVIIEADLDQRVSTRVEVMGAFEKLDVNCPDCGGGLYITQHDHPAHYRCHVGHSYTDRELVIRMSEVLESTFWTSLRMLEEKRSLLLRFYRKDIDKGYKTTAERHLERARELETHIDNLKQILIKTTEVEAA